MRTRNGHDWTGRFPNIAAALLKLNVRSAVIDGEAVVLDERGGRASLSCGRTSAFTDPSGR